ncbi:MAG: polynucleotide adenylyltransferase PcnB [Lentisphaeraceae bacterium]|nr:polynucleotide adenylyltransferase PcnB [Lentisphaeraceae bacterium]
MTKDIQLDKGAFSIIRTLQEAGHTTYLVGGAVRDFLLGIEPKDYDISTTATPEEVKKIFGRGARIIGRRFRIVHIYRSRNIYEISTFRRTPTEEERKGRIDDEGLLVWRDNEWGNPEEDAFRRDFSANALFMDPLQDNKILDYCGGLDDIKDGVVRCLGDPIVRFSEDPVRMLRAMKLVAQYNFSLDENVEHAIKELSPSISMVSQRRLFEEILKLTYKPYCAATLKACHDVGLLEHLLPEVDAILKTEDAEQFLKVIENRDDKVSSGCSLSRAYSLALLCYRFVEKELNPGCKFGECWETFDGIDLKVREAVDKFLSPYHITRLVSARVRDVLLLQRRFRLLKGRNKTRRHPEFHYAWLLFNSLAESLELPKEMVSPWEADDVVKNRRSRRRNKNSRNSDA